MYPEFTLKNFFKIACVFFNFLGKALIEVLRFLFGAMGGTTPITPVRMSTKNEEMRNSG